MPVRPMLVLARIAKTYRAGVPGCAASIDVLRGVSLRMRPGELATVEGGRGAGKTTLLLCAAGIVRPDDGSVSWPALDPHPGRPAASIGYASDRAPGYGFLTVRESLAYAAAVCESRAPGTARGTRDLLDGAELSEYADARQALLADSERARLLIAMALVASPRLLLVDDLTGGTSAHGRDAFARYLTRVAASGIARPVGGDVTAVRRRPRLCTDGRPAPSSPAAIAPRAVAATPAAGVRERRCRGSGVSPSAGRGDGSWPTRARRLSIRLATSAHRPLVDPDDSLLFVNAPVQHALTLHRAIRPADGTTVRMYTCGPTIYNPAHVGNFRTFVFEDLLRRTLRLAGWKVVQVMNLTDVDDKIIKRAGEQGRTIREVTDPIEKVFHADRKYLRIEDAEHYPRATAFIPQMVALVQRLLDRGVAYRADDGSVYFAIDRFPGLRAPVAARHT